MRHKHLSQKVAHTVSGMGLLGAHVELNITKFGLSEMDLSAAFTHDCTKYI